MIPKMFLTTFGVLFALCSSCWSFVLPNAIQLTKSIYRLEALAKEPSQQSLQILISTCRAKHQPLVVRRVACRLLARVATPGLMAEASPDIGRSDALWPSWQLAKIRVEARKERASKGAIEQKLRAFMDSQTEETAPGSRGRKDEKWSHDRVAVGDVAFHIADLDLPGTGFSAYVTGRPELQYRGLKAELGKKVTQDDKWRWIELQLKDDDYRRRTAAAALAIEQGTSSIEHLRQILDRTRPRREPPPYTSELNAYIECLRALAGIGGDKAAEILRSERKCKVRYAARSAESFLAWVDQGVKYPLWYEDILYENEYY